MICPSSGVSRDWKDPIPSTIIPSGCLKLTIMSQLGTTNNNINITNETRYPFFETRTSKESEGKLDNLGGRMTVLGSLTAVA